VTTVEPTTRNEKTLRFLAAVFAFETFVSDRVMKIVASHEFRDLGRAPAPILDVTYHENSGLIGNFPVPQPVIILVMAAAIIFVGQKLLESIRRKEQTHTIALAVILGGALGNLFDRIVYGHVIDWLLFGGRSIVNLADLSIAWGAILYMLAPKSKPFDTTSNTP